MDSSLKSFLDKTFGANFAIKGSELERVSRLRTDIVALDIAFGGGFPLGRSVELFGPESVGKTTTALHIVSAAQKAALNCVYIDLEGTLEPDHCLKADVDSDDLLVIRPSDGNEAFDAMGHLITKADYRLFVIDSIPGLIPKSDFEKFQGDSDAKGVAGVAALFARQWPVLKQYSLNHNCSFLFLNQMSSKISPMAMGGLDTPGGWRRKHLMSHRLYLKYKSNPKGMGKDDPASIETFFTVEKSKVGGAGTQGSLLIQAGRINKAYSLLTTAEALGLVARSGASYKLNEELQQTTNMTASIGVGQAKACKALEENQQLWSILYEQCINKAFGLEVNQVVSGD